MPNPVPATKTNPIKVTVMMMTLYSVNVNISCFDEESGKDGEISVSGLSFAIIPMTFVSSFFRSFTLKWQNRRSFVLVDD